MWGASLGVAGSGLGFGAIFAVERRVDELVQRVQEQGFGVESFRVSQPSNFRFRVWGSEIRVYGLGFRV